MPSRSWFLSEDPVKKAGAPSAPPPTLSVSGFNSEVGGNQSQVTIATPTETVNGDLLFCILCFHSPLGDVRFFPDDPMDGWQLLDAMKEYNAGADHRYALFWKTAVPGDVGGGASYSFNTRNTLNTVDRTDGFGGTIFSVIGAQEEATDLDFLYAWDIDEISGAGTDVLVGDMDFRGDEGDGLLLCVVINDNSITTITKPDEMVEEFNVVTGSCRVVLASETVSPSTGSMGPKRFIQSTSTDFMAFAMIIKPLVSDGRTLPLYTLPKIRAAENRSGASFSSVGDVIAEPPGDTVVDDLLVLFLAYDGGSGLSDASPDTNPESQGWAKIYSRNRTSDQALGIWWKRADADDIGTAPDGVFMDWGATHGNQDGVWAMFRFSGVTYDTADSFIGFLGQNHSTGEDPAHAPIVTVPFNDSIVINAIAFGSGTNDRRKDVAPRGSGDLIDWLSTGTSGGIELVLTVQGVPFGGDVLGENTIRQDSGLEYDWVRFYITRTAA